MDHEITTPWIYTRLICKEHKGMCYEFRTGNHVTTVHGEKIVPIEDLHHGR